MYMNSSRRSENVESPFSSLLIFYYQSFNSNFNIKNKREHTVQKKARIKSWLKSHAGDRFFEEQKKRHE